MLLALASMCAGAIDLSGTLFEKVGRTEKIDPQLLYAVALAESAYSERSDGTVAPYPWVLRTPKAPYYEPTKEAAVKRLDALLKKGISVDVGLMQINVKWHGRRVARPEDLLDPETNIRTAARILNEEFRRTPDDLIGALGRYHSRDFSRSRSYGLTVWNIYKNLTD